MAGLSNKVFEVFLQLGAAHTRAAPKDECLPDELGHLGGDEFGLLLTGRDEVAATAVASELLDVLTEPLDVTGNHLIVSASIGIAVAHDADSVGDLLRWSDIAMYRAKRVRRSGYAV